MPFGACENEKSYAPKAFFCTKRAIIPWDETEKFQRNRNGCFLESVGHTCSGKAFLSSFYNRIAGDGRTADGIDDGSTGIF